MRYFIEIFLYDPEHISLAYPREATQSILCRVARNVNISYIYFLEGRRLEEERRREERFLLPPFFGAARLAARREERLGAMVAEKLKNLLPVGEGGGGHALVL